MVSPNSMWYSILIHSKLTEIFGIKNFSATKGAGKVVIIIYFF